jgi:hypothetical protein
MIESHLEEGRQDLLPGRPLAGDSIIDACIGWAQTVPVLHGLAARAEWVTKASRQASAGRRIAGQVLDDVFDQVGVILRRAQSAGGGHTPAAGASCTSCNVPDNMGVLKVPGAMVMLRKPLRARSRAIGRGMPTTPPLLA